MAASWQKLFGAAKARAAPLMLFIPSVDREEEEIIDQEYWVEDALTLLGNCFGGATAWPRGVGVWKDEKRGGRLVRDTPVLIQCFTSKAAVRSKAHQLIDFLRRMGRETNQGAVGFVFSGEYFEIEAPF